jgi:hypothetical protein
MKVFEVLRGKILGFSGFSGEELLSKSQAQEVNFSGIRFRWQIAMTVDVETTIIGLIEYSFDQLGFQ